MQMFGQTGFERRNNNSNTEIAHKCKFVRFRKVQNFRNEENVSLYSRSQSMFAAEWWAHSQSIILGRKWSQTTTVWVKNIEKIAMENWPFVWFPAKLPKWGETWLFGMVYWPYWNESVFSLMYIEPPKMYMSGCNMKSFRLPYRNAAFSNVTNFTGIDITPFQSLLFDHYKKELLCLVNRFCGNVSRYWSWYYSQREGRGETAWKFVLYEKVELQMIQRGTQDSGEREWKSLI